MREESENSVERSVHVFQAPRASNGFQRTTIFELKPRSNNNRGGKLFMKTGKELAYHASQAWQVGVAKKHPSYNNTQVNPEPKHAERAQKAEADQDNDQADANGKSFIRATGGYH